MSNRIQTALLNHGYKIEKLIGHGGFAACLRVRSIKYNQKFVAKVMKYPTDSNDLSIKQKLSISYEKEITALCNLAHPNVLCIYDHFTEDNNLFIILEYCNQGSLVDATQKTKTINPLDIMNFLKQIVSALAYCHSKQIAHRDIKPGNILLHDGVIKIADFGISSIGKDCLEDASGSVPFLAPEILERRLHDPYKSDVWALGVTIYLIAVGNYPFACNNKEILLTNIKHGAYEMPRFINPIIQRFIRQTLVYDPNRRWSMEQLNAFINQMPIHNPLKSSLSFNAQNILFTNLKNPHIRKTNPLLKSVEITKPLVESSPGFHL